MAVTSRQLLVLLLLVACLQAGVIMAARPMPEEEHWWWRKNGVGLLLQSLPQGPVTPSGASGCTHNPNNPKGSCPH
ncbi:hypothetical protein Cni_G26367 [Canna indica]|uniref:Uncharacterized protein n=1 Tax=Canna indica TaxID=4628 RepID=A0AAQ3KZJ5_9LILI|nr:hypothetical protein Cni_G26367 [Canna indica]